MEEKKILTIKEYYNLIADVDIEGDPHNGYWYVCEECRHIVDWKMEKCPCCGRRLNWNG